MKLDTQPLPEMPEHPLVEIERLRTEVERLTRERDEAQKNYQFMVDRAVDQKLDGYRELGMKLAALEEELDRARRDRRDALSVTSREGLLASEWVARTGKAERERDQLEKALRDTCMGHYDECGCPACDFVFRKNDIR